MRKLSVASFTSSLAKRSASVASMVRAGEGDATPMDENGDNRSDVTCASGRSLTSHGDPDERRRIIMATVSVPSQIQSLNQEPPTADDIHKSGELRGLEDGNPGGRLGVGNSEQDGSALRHSSANSSRLKEQTPSASEKSLSPYLGEKENTHYAPQPATERYLTNAKAGSGWSKVGVVNKGLKATGIRSFFR
jgi:hypothetical protein